MAKRPENRYKSAAEMLEALNAYVENPAIVFNYTYLPDEIPEKVVEPPMPRKESRPERGSAPAKGRKKKKRTVFLPVLFGITVAFALACAALCWMILNDSSSLMGEKADVVLADYSGMTQDEVNASQQVASGQIVINWEQAYSNDYAAGYVYRQSPVAGRTVREGQSVTLTVSLGIQYVTVPDVSNYVQADGEQQLKDLGVSVLITQAVEPSVAAGSIIRTEPAAGQSGGCRLHGGGLCQPPAGQHHGQGACPDRSQERERCPLRAGAEQAGPWQHHRAVQRPARRYHHRPEPGGRLYRQGEQPCQHYRERRPRAGA